MIKETYSNSCRAVGQLEELPSVNELGFGRIFTAHMLMMDYKNGEWQDPRIVPFSDLDLHPASVVLHYGQQIFEGQKAFRTEDGVFLFRPDENARRFNNSARIMHMPEIKEKEQLEEIKRLIKEDIDFVPSAPASLYVRPTMIATTHELGVKVADEYLYYVILSPSGSYFKEGFKPISLLVTNEYSRVTENGVGNAKTAANYAVSLRALTYARNNGYDQVLFLDAKTKKEIEEVPAMNVFIVKNNVLVTPELSDRIIPGITRKSVLALAELLRIKSEERRITIDELIDGVESQEINEFFGTGTAAVIAPVGRFGYKGKTYLVNKGRIGKITRLLYSKLIGIQQDKSEDPFDWMKFVG